MKFEYESARALLSQTLSSTQNGIQKGTDQEEEDPDKPRPLFLVKTDHKLSSNEGNMVQRVSP